MPKAVVTTEAQHYALKTLPPDGFIKAKPLSYGQKKERADIAGKMYSEIRDNPRRGEDQKMYLESASRAATLFDYQNCITDHNLEDDNERKLDFNLASTLDILDPRVGTEIENILAKLNGDDEDLQDFISSLENSQTPILKEAKVPAS